MPTSNQMPIKNEEKSVMELDSEWIELLLLARNLGIPQDEIRSFFLQLQFKSNQSKEALPD